MLVLTMFGGGSGESGGVIATYCFSTSATMSNIAELVTVSLNAVTSGPVVSVFFSTVIVWDRCVVTDLSTN